MSIVHEHLMHATYFAPRGKKRLLCLGNSIGQRYLSPEDRLIGVIGEAGAGKSLLLRGMFPGLELTNDDDGINIRPLPLLHDAEQGHFRCRTYHVDVRFELAFTQPWVLAEAVAKAVENNRRVVLEHFDLLYPVLKINAEMLLGVGEEVLVTRPGIFGPFPEHIYKTVFNSIKYRKMAHTAEDLTGMVLAEQGIKKPHVHSDIKHGFILEFSEKPDIDLDFLEKRVQNLIDQNISVCYRDDGHIRVGESIVECTGPRIHVRQTGEITNFHLLKEFKWDPIQKLYILAGLVENAEADNWGGMDPFEYLPLV